MNIMIHAISTTMGGAKRHLDNLVGTLRDSGDDNTYFIVINDRYECSWESEKTIPLQVPAEYSNGIKRIIFDNFHINRIIREHDIDVLVSFANFGPFKAACKHILFEMNALYFCKNVFKLFDKKQRIDAFLKRTLIKLTGVGADLIVTPSMSLKNQLIETLGFPEDKIEVLYHAVDRNFTRPTKTNLPEHTDKIMFLYPSHLAKHKGVHILVEALELLKRHSPSLLKHFEIVCTFDRSDAPTYYDALTQKISEKNLSEIIRFIGHIPQESINAYYAAADYMIYTTLCESFGFSMLEAKVFRLPALCSDIPINREISKNSAKYYEAENPEDLARKIENFVTQHPKDFDFHDDLLNWDWVKYADALRNIIKKVAA